MIPEYTECMECHEKILDVDRVHAARKRERYDSAFGVWVVETVWLCCECIRTVGGSCDGH